MEGTVKTGRQIEETIYRTMFISLIEDTYIHMHFI